MTYVSTCLADGAVAIWGMGDASGTTCTDLAGNGNGAYANTGNITLGVTGISGGGGATAATFAGGSPAGCVTVGVAAAQALNDTFTLECWLKRSTLGTLQQIFTTHTSGGCSLDIDTDDKPRILKSAVSLIAKSSVAISDTTTFHHIVWTKSGATSHIYIDSVDVTGAVTNATCSDGVSDPRWNIAAFGAGAPGATSNPLLGTLQFMATYPTALSSVTVAAHYALGQVAAPTNSVAPAVTGTTTVGSVLTTTDGTWTGSPTFTYQWQRDGSNIAAATANTYTSVSGDIGHAVRCAVTGTNAGGSATANSNAITVTAATSTFSFGGAAVALRFISRKGRL